jgi:hypothetical protein
MITRGTARIVRRPAGDRRAACGMISTRTTRSVADSRTPWANIGSPSWTAWRSSGASPSKGSIADAHASLDFVDELDAADEK